MKQIVITLVIFAGLALPAFCATGKPSAPSPVMPVTALMQDIKKGEEIFLVDIRPKKEFSHFKIPGSLNIPAALIKTKSFLKIKPVVLIHSGFAHEKMVRLAKNLNQKGFRASVLRGGIAAWKHKGGDLVGNPFAYDNLATIKPHDFFAGRDEEDWLVIYMGAGMPHNKKPSIPGAWVPDLPESHKKKTNALVRLLATQRISDTATIVIFNETGLNYPALKGCFPPRYKDRVFGLKGGSTAYDKFKHMHLLANRPRPERTATTGNCEPCKKKENQ